MNISKPMTEHVGSQRFIKSKQTRVSQVCVMGGGRDHSVVTVLLAVIATGMCDGRDKKKPEQDSPPSLCTKR